MKKQRKQRLRRLAERVLERKRRKQADDISGTIRITVSGYGFVTPDSDDDTPQAEIFVPAKFTSNALDGDKVRLHILPPRKGHPEDLEKGDVGRVEEIIERSRSGFVGELLAGSVVRPLNPRLPDDVEIHGARRGAKRGDWVRVKYDFGKYASPGGIIMEIIGKAGNISADLDAVMAEFDLPGKYSEKDDLESLSLLPREIPREDCRDLFVLTIDPADAKDFDDALSIRHTPDGATEIGVHIADVAAYIAPKSKFDESAKIRAFSCYLPGRTLPMLPPALTAKISMTQDNDALAHSVFLTIAPNGKVVSSRRTHTLIRVRKRLDYDEVQDFLENGTTKQSWDDILTSTLQKLAENVRAMRDYRKKHEFFIDLPLPEIRVVCDEKNNTVSGLEKRVSRESEQLVEECMLAANQSVGLELSQRGVAGIYRIHPIPEPEKTMEFSDLMHENFNLPVGDISDRKTCCEFISSLPDDGKKEIILNLLLRSLPRASYATTGSVHFALGKTFYAHFTSPIRRYPDLLVHQQLWNFDKQIRTRSGKTLESVAAWASEQEENIDAACFAAADRLKLRILKEIMESAPERLYDGRVIKITAAGLQVDVDEFGLYGFVERDRLRPRRSLSMRPGDPRKSDWKIGDYICLRLISIDFARGCAIFMPAR